MYRLMPAFAEISTSSFVRFQFANVAHPTTAKQAASASTPERRRSRPSSQPIGAIIASTGGTSRAPAPTLAPLAMHRAVLGSRCSEHRIASMLQHAAAVVGRISPA
jgi:hypothetical protein